MRKATRRTDLKTLARALGVSMTTVSRALNGYPDVSASTRERVIARAREMGYTPNVQARRLTSGATECIGFVLDTVDAYYSDPYFAELLAGITDALTQANFDLVITSSKLHEDPLFGYRRLVEQGRVDGILIDRTRRNDARVAFLLERGMPFVTFGRDGRSGEHAFLDLDNELGFLLGVRHLTALGHRRIAMIGASDIYNFAHLRRVGYERGLEEAGLAFDPLLYGEDGMSEMGGRNATLRLLDLDDPPTAILAIDDRTAIGAMHAIRERGLAAGTDLSVIGYNDVPIAAETAPPLTTLRASIRPAGRRLAHMLVEIIAGAAPALFQEVWEPVLVLRHTAGPPRPPAAAESRHRPARQLITR